MLDFCENGKTENAGLTNRRLYAIINLAFAGVAHLVERDLAKVEVASSSLVARSKKKTPSVRMVFSFWNVPQHQRTRCLDLREARQIKR